MPVSRDSLQWIMYAKGICVSKEDEARSLTSCTINKTTAITKHATQEMRVTSDHFTNTMAEKLLITTDHYNGGNY